MESNRISPVSMSIPMNNGEVRPAILQERDIELKWPSTMRIGDIKTIELTFLPTAEGFASSRLYPGLVDVYTNYNVMVEARYEVAGVNVIPANPTRESLFVGQSVRFKWDISVYDEGDFTGTIWLSLRFVPLDGSDPVQVPIFVNEVTLHARTLFNMSGPVTRITGSLGFIIVIFLFFNDMIIIIKRKKSNVSSDGKVIG